MLDYLLYGRLYLPSGRLDALYSTRISPTMQALVAAVSHPSSNLPGRGGDVSNLMFNLQHDVGKWCTEYSYSAEDGMWGFRVLHNFGRLGLPADATDDNSPIGSRAGLKRVDEEDAVEGGLKGRVSAGAEIYLSAKEKSLGGESFFVPLYFGMAKWPFQRINWTAFHNASRCYSAFVSGTISIIITLSCQGTALTTSHDNNSTF